MMTMTTGLRETKRERERERESLQKEGYGVTFWHSLLGIEYVVIQWM